MKHEEEWKLLNNPARHEDYGILIGERELRTFPEGRRVLLEIRLLQRQRKKTKRFMINSGAAMRLTQEKIMINVLNNHDHQTGA